MVGVVNSSLLFYDDDDDDDARFLKSLTVLVTGEFMAMTL